MRVDNAIIMAAGTSSRFAPLSYEKHKALTIVKGEVLIERQIKQLHAAGISDIYIVTGYKAEQFEYLSSKYNIRLIYNPEYLSRNNNGSIWAARKILNNSYICSADNYFSQNPFELYVEDAYYSAVYADGFTSEWCMTEDERGYIDAVTIGGANSWYMLGHTFWSQNFSKQFLTILENEYDKEVTKNKLWESIYIEHLDKLKMKMKKYDSNTIYEFDTLDELRMFDTSYITDTRSILLKKIAKELSVTEDKIIDISTIKSNTTEAVGFDFNCDGEHYTYFYDSEILRREE